jgi:transcriptional regulator with XRE-family HTH domain
MNFGQMLVTARTNLNLLQKDLAEKTDIPSTSICRYEGGKRTPPTDCFILQQLSKTLNLDYVALRDRAFLENGRIPKEYFEKMTDSDIDSLIDVIKYLVEGKGGENVLGK